MKRFADMYWRLDSTTKTNEKVAAMCDYFTQAPPHDAAWAISILSGRKIRQLVPSRLLRQWAAEEAGIPDWLFEESYSSVGDLAETISLVVPPGESVSDTSLVGWIENKLLPLRPLTPEQQHDAVVEIWQQTDPAMRFVVMKLITGGLRVGVSKALVTRALAQASGISSETIAHRLMGDWEPNAEFFHRVVDPNEGDTQISRPYPFCLAHPIEQATSPDRDGGAKQAAEIAAVLGETTDFAAEWKWDGIRGQIIRREGETFLWSRGEDLMENRWPEIEDAASLLPNGTVIDGEILACAIDQDGNTAEVLPFSQLQRRIGRKRVGKKLLKEVPVVFHAFDLMEVSGNDIRQQPFRERRRQLQQVLNPIRHPNLCVTELIDGNDWLQWATVRETSRERHSEGLMLKRWDSVYDVGRVRGTWWKWKVQPYTIDAVLIYAQRGHGKRASLYTDYTFALWDEGNLVPVAKAYSGLDDAEIRKVDRFVRQNTSESFGPVRSVTPELVFEIAFEGISQSTRHKSGVATRFPRILRWRHDKRAEDANQLSDLKALLPDG
ncbi:ATP-dependent DNA ligase [Rhodopirellula sp. MGV]|uniref:ATP-dependent DNA ligase n=1 Tax=Rhodopirellula sp. MGV TaxID=2023130 RepID=UPI000B963CDF|nr:ATP-dependent DNA ligase [Rhodopirellula sp. MGV]OYP35951.1 ATP-dependent DNA ligase [Rhodopirellula sp. MGV]PNY34873.1 ATP-dependent DNA ligase [Rhodopirellula baltica]